MASAIDIAYSKKVREYVDYLYSLTHNRTLDMGLRRYRRYNLLMDCGFALLELGAIENIGTPAYPKYSWVRGAAPDDEFYLEVRKKIQERSARERSEPIDLRPHLQSPVDSEVLTECGLDGFSDQELWNELKTRGYYIADNVLCKKVILES